VFVVRASCLSRRASEDYPPRNVAVNCYRVAGHYLVSGRVGVWSEPSVLITTSPIFGALIAAFRGNAPSLKAWFGILLAFLGVVIVINNSLTSITIGIGSILGDLLIISASFMWAIYTFVSEPIVARRGPIFVTAWAMLFGAIILTAFGVPSLLDQGWVAMPGISWLAWASTTVFGAALAFVWYCAGITRIGITRGMVYSYFIPVVAILTAVLFFEESMTIVQIFGALVVFSGVALTRAN
jgi:drug/metabolite transporter (DMT)-like permease